MKIFLDTANVAEIKEGVAHRRGRRRHHQSVADRQGEAAVPPARGGDLLASCRAT